MKVLVLGLLAWFAVACQPDAEKKNMAENEIIARQVYERFNAHDWEGMAALYSDSTEFKDPAFGTKAVMQSRKQIVEKYAAMHKETPDIHDEITGVYPSGDKRVIVEFVSSGSMPDGDKWELPICTVFTIEKGKIIKDYTYYDQE